MRLSRRLKRLVDLLGEMLQDFQPFLKLLPVFPAVGVIDFLHHRFGRDFDHFHQELSFRIRNF